MSHTPLAELPVADRCRIAQNLSLWGFVTSPDEYVAVVEGRMPVDVLQRIARHFGPIAAQSSNAPPSCSCTAHREQGAVASCSRCSPVSNAEKARDVAAAINGGRLPGICGHAHAQDGVVMVSLIAEGAPSSISGVFRAYERQTAAMTDEQLATCAKEIAARDDAWAARHSLPTGPCGECGGDAVEHNAISHMWRSTPPTPAAMLGEAVCLIERAQDLIRRTPRASDVLASAALRSLDVGKHRVQGMVREDAERGGLQPPSTVQADSNSCWQCEAPLGTTEACIMCAAKRAEDRAMATEGLQPATSGKES